MGLPSFSLVVLLCCLVGPSHPAPQRTSSSSEDNSPDNSPFHQSKAWPLLPHDTPESYYEYRRTHCDCERTGRCYDNSWNYCDPWPGYANPAPSSCTGYCISTALLAVVLALFIIAFIVHRYWWRTRWMYRPVKGGGGDMEDNNAIAILREATLHWEDARRETDKFLELGGEAAAQLNSDTDLQTGPLQKIGMMEKSAGRCANTLDRMIKQVDHLETDTLAKLKKARGIYKTSLGVAHECLVKMKNVLGRLLNKTRDLERESKSLQNNGDAKLRSGSNEADVTRYLRDKVDELLRDGGEVKDLVCEAGDVNDKHLVPLISFLDACSEDGLAENAKLAVGKLYQKAVEVLPHAAAPISGENVPADNGAGPSRLLPEQGMMLPGDGSLPAGSIALSGGSGFVESAV